MLWIILGVLFVLIVPFGLIFWCACKVSAMADRELEEQVFRKQLEEDVNNG
ncbi:hypothetical protein [Streptococcus intermedius]|uniref:hypothetical protein n=1 Tax=Streptococcus intermedius TaxID=1338 RepID=UPI0013C34EAB|nr:hypothetical protein [Streptococcus intermedius]